MACPITQDGHNYTTPTKFWKHLPHIGHCHYMAESDLQHILDNPFHTYHLDNTLHAKDSIFNSESVSQKMERHLFNGLFFRKTWLSQHHKSSTILDFNEARDNGVAVASSGPYANHLHLTPYR